MNSEGLRVEMGYDAKVESPDAKNIIPFNWAENDAPQGSGAPNQNHITPSVRLKDLPISPDVPSGANGHVWLACELISKLARPTVQDAFNEQREFNKRELRTTHPHKFLDLIFRKFGDPGWKWKIGRVYRVSNDLVYPVEGDDFAYLARFDGEVWECRGGVAIKKVTVPCREDIVFSKPDYVETIQEYLAIQEELGCPLSFFPTVEAVCNLMRFREMVAMGGYIPMNAPEILVREKTGALIKCLVPRGTVLRQRTYEYDMVAFYANILLHVIQGNSLGLSIQKNVTARLQHLSGTKLPGCRVFKRIRVGTYGVLGQHIRTQFTIFPRNTALMTKIAQTGAAIMTEITSQDSGVILEQTDGFLTRTRNPKIPSKYAGKFELVEKNVYERGLVFHMNQYVMVGETGRLEKGEYLNHTGTHPKSIHNLCSYIVDCIIGGKQVSIPSAIEALPWPTREESARGSKMELCSDMKWRMNGPAWVCNPGNVYRLYMKPLATLFHGLIIDE
jgi:hypothetical protein